MRAIDLSDVLDPERSLSVTRHGQARRAHALAASSRRRPRTPSSTRSATRFGARSNVDRDDPDVRVVVHVVRDEAELYLDLAGEPLHRRGYRTEAREAPIKETLAAAMLRLAGWDRMRPLVDPMCGSGTIAIEARSWARDIAPGLLGRKPTAFSAGCRYDPQPRKTR